jgi:2-polyprenyl-3-methyl-5-hydroxy-6-metoxy-1,4-benzoquinol methylase
VSRAPDYYRADKGRMVAYVPAGARRVLDVGCGAGRFGAQLKAQRPEVEVWGVEVEAGPAEEARRHLDHVHHGRYPEAIPELDGPFDCVVFNDVLEHLEDPWAALDATHGALVEGGSIVLSIPNLRNWRTLIDLLRHGIFRYEDRGVHDVSHLRFFTRSTALQAVEDSGWTVTTVEMVNPLGYRRAWLFGWLLRPIAPSLRDEADFKQIAIVARAG